MKALTWSFAEATGDGTRQRIRLEQPESKRDFYRDIAVLAWPLARSSGGDDRAFPRKERPIAQLDGGVPRG